MGKSDFTREAGGEVADAVDPREPSSSPSRRSLSSLRGAVKGTVARWLTHKTMSGAERVDRARDEATHPWNGRLGHSESYTFVGLQRGLTVVTRLEWVPAQRQHRVWVLLWLDGQQLAARNADGGCELVVQSAGGDRWDAGGLHIDCLNPYRHWRVVFRGAIASPQGAFRRCQLELDFHCQRPTFWLGRDDDPALIADRLRAARWNRQLLRLVRARGHRSYVQVGHVSGRVRVDEQVVAVHARGHRQHAWGVQDLGASESVVRCYAHWPDDHEVWCQRVHFPGLTLDSGCVSTDHGLVGLTHLRGGATSDATSQTTQVQLQMGADAWQRSITATLEQPAQFPSDNGGRLRVAPIVAAPADSGLGEVLGVVAWQTRRPPLTADVTRGRL